VHCYCLAYEKVREWCIFVSMQTESQSNELMSTRTRDGYVWTRVLDTPFWGLFNLLPFILYKDLFATPFQLALLITLKPLVSIFSSYWAARVYAKPSRLLPSIILARWIAYLPFLLLPIFHNAWYLIFCFGLFMFLQVGMMPAWMELLKQNVPNKTREKVFSYAQAFGYLGGGLLPFALGWVLDEWKGAWHWMFPLAALVALTSQFWQRKILVNPASFKPTNHNEVHPLWQPWRNAWEVLRQRSDFTKFQIGFMLIGSGLMIIQPSLPIFFVDRLHLSYTELGVAITLCKGVGFACGSPLWVRWMQQVNLFHFGALIALLAALFPFLLLAAQVQMGWLYIAFLMYGFMQSGNELSWNMSGPTFARQEDSAPYSSVNIIAVGLRGALIPSIGALCLEQFGLNFVIVLSSILCLLASFRMAIYSKKNVLQNV